ncbi:MAG: Flavin-dependent monooxygenase, oxygenase subunit HsaA [Alphaproteobacteria bacterium MarineAlpha11_Bin1]|nr:MAG: Flavin-dependent monooxygenase, oxygenase subunit HsaA [Alphaproteobacteria bacterium MarineAlpha11_Bin1]|tara:strand:- start:7454 stop:8662 length:1209 start_codon:yes stop_codon:yes gene_type:complete
MKTQTVQLSQSKINASLSAITAARQLSPSLRRRAVETDNLRRLPKENIVDMKASGLFRILQASRNGGWQLDFHTHLDVVEEVASACGASGWCLGVLQIHSWLAGLMSQQAQDEVYSDDSNALIAAVLVARGTATQNSDGYCISGFWPFGSGSEHSDWVILGASVEDKNGNEIDQGVFLMPTSEIEINDDWYVAGLRGTGSCSLVATDVKVPIHRYLSTVEGRLGKTPGAHLHEGTLFQSPLTPCLSIALCGPAVGIAEGAIRDFISHVPGRSNPQLRGAAQIESPLTHKTVAEAKASVDAARMLLHRAADDIELAAGNGGEMRIEVRTRIRMDCAYAVRLCMNAGEMIFLATGGSGLADTNPIQRAWRDLHAINQHALLQLQTNAEIYGRTILGLDPGSDIL